jgi:hypothetical protein
VDGEGGLHDGALVGVLVGILVEIAADKAKEDRAYHNQGEE